MLAEHACIFFFYALSFYFFAALGVLKPSLASTVAKGGNTKQPVASAGTKAGEKHFLYQIKCVDGCFYGREELEWTANVKP